MAMVFGETKDKIFMRGRAEQAPRLIEEGHRARSRQTDKQGGTKQEGETVFLELPRDLAKLIAVCEQAPCGRGTETVLDTKVRKVLQTDAVKVLWGEERGESESVLSSNSSSSSGSKSRSGSSNSNSSKSKSFLNAAVQQVREQLCPWIPQLRAEFYKVLVYRQGDFFECHRDSKKAEQHVATLVVDLGLPCRGGQVEFPSVDHPAGSRHLESCSTRHLELA